MDLDCNCRGAKRWNERNKYNQWKKHDSITLSPGNYTSVQLKLISGPLKEWQTIFMSIYEGKYSFLLWLSHQSLLCVLGLGKNKKAKATFHCNSSSKSNVFFKTQSARVFAKIYFILSSVYYMDSCFSSLWPYLYYLCAVRIRTK